MEPDKTDPIFSVPPVAPGTGLAAGQTVGGRYRLRLPVGRGGMGMVWLVEDLSLGGECVALKFLLPEIGHDAVALDEMRREALKSRKLTHPNIVRIHDFHAGAGELPFISMEYVSGETLSALRLKEPSRVFTWEFLAPLVAQLCDALDYAHGEKVIHRDLKPSNLMLDGKGRLKLADFGIAAVASDSISRISLQNLTSGTLSYMSPQQLDGAMPRPADDIYALGVTLYELLTSQPPFHSGDIAHQVRNLPAKPLVEQLDENFIANPIPPAVSTMIMACLAKEPSQRPATARDAAERAGLSFDSKGSASSPVRDSGQGGGIKPGHSRKRIALAGGAVAAMLLTGGVWHFGFRPGAMESGIVTGPPAKHAAPDVGWISLFDGQTLAGWDGDPRYWSVKGGVICGDLPAGLTADNTSFLIWRGGKVDDFELRLWVRFDQGKSGVFYRASDRGGWKAHGYEFNLLYPRTGGLALVLDEGKGHDLQKFERDFYLKEVEPHLHQSDWNEITIRARGSRFQHEINGHQVVNVSDADPLARVSGLLALQLRPGRGDSATTVRFKDIQLRRLTPGTGSVK